MIHTDWIRVTTGIMVAAMLLSAVVSGVAVGQISAPSSYYGDAVTEDGTEAPEGTTIVAVVGGTVEDSITVNTAGEYGSTDDNEYLRIPSNSDNVTFHVGDADGPQADPPGEITGTNIENGVERQNLTFPTGAFTYSGGDDGSTTTTTDDGSTTTTDDGSTDGGSAGGGSIDDGSTTTDDGSTTTDDGSTPEEDESEQETTKEEKTTIQTTVEEQVTTVQTSTSEETTTQPETTTETPGFGFVVSIIGMAGAAMLGYRKRKKQR